MVHIELYLQYRRDGWPARIAVRLARYKERKPLIIWAKGKIIKIGAK